MIYCLTSYALLSDRTVEEDFKTALKSEVIAEDDDQTYMYASPCGADSY
jgi:hypothetical protein